MEPAESRRVELILPMRTVLVVAAAIGLMAAFAAIGDTFLIVFVGIFLAFVFEFPVRFVMARTRMSRGLAATATVFGTALLVGGLLLLLLVPLVGSVRDFLQQLPEIVAELRASDELSSWLGDSGAAGNVQDGAEQISVSIPDAISSVLGIAGGFFTVFIAGFTILFTCLFLLTDVGNLKRSLTSILMPGDDERWLTVWERVTEHLALGDRRHRHRDDRGDDPGDHRVDPRIELRRRSRRHRRAARHDPEHRRDDRRLHPRSDALGRGGPDSRDHHAGRRSRVPAAREQRAHAEDPGQGRPAVGVLHHHLRDAVRGAARRSRRADRGAARRDDPDLRPGAHEGAARAGRRCESGRRACVGTTRLWPNRLRPGFEEIRDAVALYPGRMDACFVDDERVEAQPGDFYGGWTTSDVVGPLKGDPGTSDW